MGVYAPTDYVVYLGILAVILVVLYKLFQKIRFDEKLITSVLPFIFVGTFIRVLADLRIYEWNQWWSVTPGVYIVTILLALLFIGMGLIFQKLTGKGYETVPFISGLAIAAYLFSLIIPRINDLALMAYPVILALLITLTVYALSYKLRIRALLSLGSFGIMFAHMLDASSTYIAYDFHGFYEEHILPRFFISLVGDTALVMIPAKLLLVGLTLHYLEKWSLDEKSKKNTNTIYLMTRFLLFIIGIGPGLRNTMLPALDL